MKTEEKENETNVESKNANNGKKEIRARVFNIMQYEEVNGEIKLSEETIKTVLEKRKSIKKWAWIIHDRDIDENGNYKKKHFHIVIMFENAMKLSQIATWFGIKENFIQIPKGSRNTNPFYDCVQYLTHQDIKQIESGKTVYDPTEVKANFDWQKEIEEYIARKTSKGKGGFGDSDREKVDNWIMGIKSGDYDLEYLREEDFVLYVRNKKLLEEAKREYLNGLNMPSVRVNYYIYGSGGSGKGLMSRALARTLFPDMKDEEIFFEIGAGKVSFDGYTGQPVLIWNDVRVAELLESLGGRGNVFDIFDTTPTRKRQNVKYGNVVLRNVVNIANSVCDFRDFLDGLAGEYIDSRGVLHNAEDKNQSYRRFPIIVPIRDTDFDIYINMGFIYGRPEYYQQYVEMKNIQGSLKAMVGRYTSEIYRLCETKITEPIVIEHKKIVESRTPAKSNLEELTQEEFDEIAKLGQK